MKVTLKKTLFNKVYLPMLTDYSKRYEVYYGGAGSGKSKFITQKLIYKALQSPRTILVLRKVGRTNKNSTFQLFQSSLSDWKLLDYCKINKTDLTIMFPNGSKFIFAGLDDQEKLKSIAGLTDAWLEESTEFTLDDFTQVDLRIRAMVPNQQILLSFNPVSKANWCYLHFFAENEDLNKFRSKCNILQTTFKDNKWLDAEYIESLEEMKATHPVFYKIYAEGQFGSLDKLVYNNWQKMDFDYTKITGELMVGLDFGFTNDPTALIASIVNQQEKRIYVFRERGGKGMLGEDIANLITEEGFAKSTIIADSARPEMIEEIRRRGCYRIKASIKGPDSVLSGIQKLQQYELIIHPSCSNTIEELQNYAWKKDKQTNEYVNEAVDKFNHYLDALRYSLQCVNINPKLRTIDKSALF